MWDPIDLVYIIPLGSAASAAAGGRSRGRVEPLGDAVVTFVGGNRASMMDSSIMVSIVTSFVLERHRSSCEWQTSGNTWFSSTLPDFGQSSHPYPVACVYGNGATLSASLLFFTKRETWGPKRKKPYFRLP